MDQDSIWKHIEIVGGCWVWQKAVNSTGYPIVWLDGRAVCVHRAVYQSLHGAIPVGAYVRRTCGCRLCCNPDHLRLEERPTLEERFWSKTNRGDADVCWLWQAAGCSNGYPMFWYAGVLISARRVAWALGQGGPEHLAELGVQEFILPECLETLCCNPTHLVVGGIYDRLKYFEEVHGGSGDVGTATWVGKMERLARDGLPTVGKNEQLLRRILTGT